MVQIKIEFPMYAVTGSLYNNIDVNSGRYYNLQLCVRAYAAGHCENP